MATEIEKKLDQMNNKLDLMLQWKAGFEERCIAYNQKTEELRCTVYGEKGCNGLVKQVDRLVQCKGLISRWRNFWMGVLKVVVATFIISLTGWLLFIYRSS